MPAALAALCALDGDNATTVRQHFSGLGERWLSDMRERLLTAEIGRRTATVALENARESKAHPAMAEEEALTELPEAEAQQANVQAGEAKADQATARAEQAEAEAAQAAARAQRLDQEVIYALARARYAAKAAAEAIARAEQTEVETARAAARAERAESAAARSENAKAEAERQAAQARQDLAEARARADDAAIAASRFRQELAQVASQRDALVQSTTWKATWPIRAAGSRLSPRGRRILRGGAKLVWWTLTFKLPRKLRERHRLIPESHASAPVLPDLMLSPSDGAQEEASQIHAGAQDAGSSSVGGASEVTELAVPPSGGNHEEVGHIRTGTQDTGPLPLDSALLRARIAASGLFDPDVYRSLNRDLPNSGADPWDHLLSRGLREGRHFTSPEVAARALATLDADIQAERRRLNSAAEAALTATDHDRIAALFRQHAVRIGVFRSSLGGSLMHGVANLLALGLRALGIEVVERDENASKDEPFDLRVFVAPHEFFWIGEGHEWRGLANAASSVLYNVEPVQTPGFCRAFPLLLGAPLVLDIDLQTTQLLRRAGCHAVHFMPGYLPEAPCAQAYTDVSEVELLKGYDFVRRPYNWLERNFLEDRPIDLLFVGGNSLRRHQALARLQELADRYRFVCVFIHQSQPLTTRNYRTTSLAINCALGQRSKIVLNVQRDWLGCFQWSRMVLQGFWQGACVVSDPAPPCPIYEPGIHYVEENVRYHGELIRWLLETRDGREMLDTVRLAGFHNALTLGSMRVALAPLIGAFAALLPDFGACIGKGGDQQGVLPHATLPS